MQIVLKSGSCEFASDVHFGVFFNTGLIFTYIMSIPYLGIHMFLEVSE